MLKSLPKVAQPPAEGESGIGDVVHGWITVTASLDEIRELCDMGFPGRLSNVPHESEYFELSQRVSGHRRSLGSPDKSNSGAELVAVPILI